MPDLTSDWQHALRLFAADQRSRRISETTITRRVTQLQRVALDLSDGPWKVTREDILCALEGLGVARNTRATYRDSLRSFYRWGAGSGRIHDDPTEEPSRRAQVQPLSPEWEAPFRAYLASMRAAGLSQSTAKVRMSQLRRFGRDHAHLSPWDVTLDDLNEWFGAKRWAKETRHAHRSAVRSFYQWAKLTHRVKKNPAKRLPVFQSATPAPRPADVDDYELAFLRADDRERVALRLAMELGMRCGEVARTHGGDLRGADGRWSLRVHGKGDKVRQLPVPDDLAHAIHAHGNTWVFPGQIDGHISPGHLGKLINRLLPRGTTMHMLRHRFATDAYAIDRDTFSVQRLLGHSSPATTQRYVQIDDDSLRRTVDAVRARRVHTERAEQVA